MIYSRKDYMYDKCTFDEFYEQFYCHSMRDYILRCWSIDELSAAYKKDIHLNTLSMVTWDKIAVAFKGHVTSVNKKINGKSTWSNSDGVCVVKTTAKIMINRVSTVQEDLRRLREQGDFENDEEWESTQRRIEGEL